MLQNLDLEQKTLIKTYLQVELNEWMMNQMETEVFAGVDEMQKAQFIGKFFGWIREKFAQMKHSEDDMQVQQQKEKHEKE